MPIQPLQGNFIHENNVHSKESGPDCIVGLPMKAGLDLTSWDLVKGSNESVDKLLIIFLYVI